MKVLQLFDEVKTALQNIYSIEESNQIAKILFEDFNIAKGKDIIVYPEAIVNQENINLIRNSLLRLLNHEPIQYITGKAYFYENYFQVNSSTLIPRNETEELVEWIIHSNPTQKQMIDIIDLGTGSGCIAITLNQYYNQAHVTAVDISKDAIEVAKVNNRNLKTNVEFIIDNILNPSANYQQYDIIVSNPPYVVEDDKKWMNSNVLDFEPYQALFVTNNDPLQFYRATIKFSKKHLKTGGSIFCEIHENYAEITKQLFDEHYHEVILKKDLNGKYRMLKASLGI